MNVTLITSIIKNLFPQLKDIDVDAVKKQAIDNVQLAIKTIDSIDKKLNTIDAKLNTLLAINGYREPQAALTNGAINGHGGDSETGSGNEAKPSTAN